MQQVWKGVQQKREVELPHQILRWVALDEAIWRGRGLRSGTKTDAAYPHLSWTSHQLTSCSTNHFCSFAPNMCKSLNPPNLSSPGSQTRHFPTKPSSKHPNSSLYPTNTFFSHAVQLCPHDPFLHPGVLDLFPDDLDPHANGTTPASQKYWISQFHFLAEWGPGKIYVGSYISFTLALQLLPDIVKFLFSGAHLYSPSTSQTFGSGSQGV